jgi:hypothetical protein
MKLNVVGGRPEAGGREEANVSFRIRSEPVKFEARETLVKVFVSSGHCGN